MDKNLFDNDIGNSKGFNKLDYLIHSVFRQNKDGMELLKIWVENSLIMNPVIVKGDNHNPYDIGITEGIKTFIRNLLITCDKVDKGER